MGPDHVLTDTKFGTTGELHIPSLPSDNGTDEVMAYFGASAGQGYLVKPDIAASEDGKIHDYTMIWDIHVRDADPTDWTAATPDGWEHVNSTPAGGPKEFQGWTFQDPLAWAETEGDQGSCRPAA